MYFIFLCITWTLIFCLLYLAQILPTTSYLCSTHPPTHVSCRPSLIPSSPGALRLSTANSPWPFPMGGTLSHPPPGHFPWWGVPVPSSPCNISSPHPACVGPTTTRGHIGRSLILYHPKPLLPSMPLSLPSVLTPASRSCPQHPQLAAHPCTTWKRRGPISDRALLLGVLHMLDSLLLHIECHLQRLAAQQRSQIKGTPAQTG